MIKLLKILLVWLCVLSLPVQGMAAVTQLSCGAAHHHPVSAEQAVHEHDASGDHGAQANQHPQQHQPSADKCSVCASCCTGLGMVATLPQWQSPGQAHAALVATFKSLLPSFLPEGLERPPRPSLA